MYYPVSSILIEFLVLAIVEKQDSYGYEISQTIKIVADIKESTLYPILKKIGKGGLRHHLYPRISRRKRKYYTITPAGREHIPFLQGEWNSYKDHIDGIIEGSLRK